MVLGYDDKVTKFIFDTVKRHAGALIDIKVASPEQDMKRATDYVVTTTCGDVAVRIREAATTFRDWTIRAKTRYDNETEIHKLVKGYAKLYIYGWKGQDGNVIDFIVIDLDIVRARGLLNDWQLRRIIPNGDGTGFLNYTLAELRPTGALLEEKFWVNQPSLFGGRLFPSFDY